MKTVQFGEGEVTTFIMHNKKMLDQEIDPENLLCALAFLDIPMKSYEIEVREQ